MPRSAYKECRKCGETKPTDEFPRSRSHRDGFFSWCKLCKAADQRERNRKNYPGIAEREAARAAELAEWAEAAKTALCECGCGQNPGVYETRGRNKGKPRPFVPGHSHRGKRLTAEHRARITGRPTEPNAGPSAIHTWLKNHHPKTGRCDECGTKGKTDYAFQRHPEPYTRDIADYRELCRSCHFRLDEPALNRTAQMQEANTPEGLRRRGRKGAEARWGHRKDG